MPRTSPGGQSFSRPARCSKPPPAPACSRGCSPSARTRQPVDRQRSEPADDRLCGEEQDPDERILWREADALHLPFEDGAFDAVLCQFGVMFFPDRVAGYAEALRVLKPGGAFLFNVWDRIENNEFANAVTEAVACLFPRIRRASWRGCRMATMTEALSRPNSKRLGSNPFPSRQSKKPVPRRAPAT